MRQCLRETCRFRFPVPAGSNAGKQCPRCEALTAFATEPMGSSEPPVEGNTSGPHVEALLDNIRSALNVGAIFRTADGAGIKRLHLAGITATPDHPRVIKTALGAETSVPWSYYGNGLAAAHALQEQGYRLWALESRPHAISLFQVRPETNRPLLFVVGHEKAGVDPGILALCEQTLHIPMAGHKSSLNVATAFGVAAYYLRYGQWTVTPEE